MYIFASLVLGILFTVIPIINIVNIVYGLQSKSWPVTVGKVLSFSVSSSGNSVYGLRVKREYLVQLVVLAGEFPCRPEVQVRGRRLLAYPADRNATVDDIATLDKLLRFARRVVDSA